MITLKYIGKSADDLRFFILKNGAHAGGVTVHSAQGDTFSYGIAISPQMRRQGIAKAALPLLYQEMKRRGFRSAVVCVAPGNAASLALHRSLGFAVIQTESEKITLRLPL
ncbi:MAG: GNAT family N-acetyltransferase [Clostridia bacterium]|nr:GNAT family N-acetyltransferase [Clostridia bacterium]